MASTPKSENIAEWIRAKLAGITAGATYHYTPNAALRIEVLTTSLLNSAYTLRYFVRAGEDRLSERTSKSFDVVSDFYVTGAYKYGGLNRDEPELQTGTLPQTIQNRLLADITNALTDWEGNSVGIENIEINSEARYEPTDGWVIVLVSCIVRWSFMQGQA